MLNGLTVFSLLLALGVAASWVRSYWRRDCVAFVERDGLNAWILLAPRGHVKLEIGHGEFSMYFGRWKSGVQYLPGPADDVDGLDERFPGIAYEQRKHDPPGILFAGPFLIAHGYLVALFAALPLIRFYRRLRRRHLVLPGHCIQCGYDLRATPDRCPECGTVAEGGKARNWKLAKSLKRKGESSKRGGIGA